MRKNFIKTTAILMSVMLMATTNVVAEESEYYNENQNSKNQYLGLDKDDFLSTQDYEKYLLSLSPEQQISTFSMPDLKPTKTVKSNVTYNFNYSSAACSLAIQNFCFASDGYIYVTQNSGGNDGYNKTAVAGDVILSRCKLSNNEINVIDSMILKGVGHGQTLENYTYKSKSYFLISTESNKVNNVYWSTQIGRIQYAANTTINASNINRLNYLSYANKDMKSSGTVKRCDAAISSNNDYLLIWAKLSGDNSEPIQYSCYDFNTINQQLDKATKVSFKGNNTLKGALKYSILQRGSKKIFPQSSFQGIEVTNNMNMYISSGKIDDSPWICNVTKSGTWKSTVKVAFENISKFEMEGIKIRGDYIYFAAKVSDGNGKIGRISKSELD